MIHHVLLMLSTKQPPHPEAEVAFHATHAAEQGRTWLVTTRRLKELTPGSSIVALYGDVALGNRLLGCGTYHSTKWLSTWEGDRQLADSPLYRVAGKPHAAVALLELSGVRVAAAGATLGDLNGIITASGLPLAIDNLPVGPARAQVYYRAADPSHPSRCVD